MFNANNFSLFGLLDEIQQSTLRQIWPLIAQETNGKGCELGGDLSVPLRYLASLEKQGQKKEHTLLLKFLTNAWWTEADRYDHSLRTNDLCDRCGQNRGTLAHHLYECPATTNSTDIDIKNSKGIADRYNYGTGGTFTPAFFFVE